MIILAIACVLFAIFRMSSPEAKSTSAYAVGACKTSGDREVQEDNYGMMETNSGLLVVVADGMGRRYGGKIAARIAVDTFIDLFKDYNAFDHPLYYFRKAFNAANNAILDAVDEQRGSSSVASAMIRNHNLYYALVGNITIAVFRNEDLVPIS